MSFRCDFCSVAQDAGTVPKMVITKIRQRDYAGIPGSEIAQEKKACQTCYVSAGPAVISPVSPALDAALNTVPDEPSSN